MRDELTQYQTDAANAATRAWGLYRVPLLELEDPDSDDYVENDDAVLLGVFDAYTDARAAADAAFDRFTAAGRVAPLLDVVPGWVVDGDFLPDE